MTEKMMAEWFWVDRWMCSSAFALPIEPRGLYREMLTQAWRRGARLPKDPAAIRRLCGVDRDEWDRCWPLVEPYWTASQDGPEWICNETQVEVYAEAIGKRDRAQARAQAGAQARHKQVLKHEPPSPSPSPVVTTYQKSLPVVVVPEPSDADAARGELKAALSDLRQRFPSFAFDADQAILDNPRFHSTGGGICRIETCTNPGLLRATAAKVRAYGKQPKPKDASRGAPAWDLGTTRYTEAEILAWDERLGPKPQPANPA